MRSIENWFQVPTIYCWVTGTENSIKLLSGAAFPVASLAKRCS